MWRPYVDFTKLLCNFNIIIMYMQSYFKFINMYLQGEADCTYGTRPITAMNHSCGAFSGVTCDETPHIWGVSRGCPSIPIHCLRRAFRLIFPEELSKMKRRERRGRVAVDKESSRR